ncbi:MAG: selenide, water dikinase SelD, partial [Syntrophorhabdaceae bacterium]|nr:selenide, water dikinase SelD [Syntrophorhabdaceae bacterium]MDD5242808.1 selenide, water dikinase SelD [Syntrophorhabdaceae bacterium]
VPGGLYRNRDFYKEHVISEVEDFFYDIIFDPQTSGGLLFAVAPEDLPAFEKNATSMEVDFRVIGKFLSEPKGKIILRP